MIITLKNLLSDPIIKTCLRDLAVARLPSPEPLFVLFALLLAFDYTVVAQENVGISF